MTRVRVTRHRMEDLVRWVKKNKTATWQQFAAEMNGTKSQFYYARKVLGISRHFPKISEARKRFVENQKKAAATEAAKPTPHKVVEEGIVEGTTPDFIWYEMDLMQRKLGDLSSRIAHVMKVAQGRDADQKKMMHNLIQENTELRVENNSLKQQVAEFTEMINGTSV